MIGSIKRWEEGNQTLNPLMGVVLPSMLLAGAAAFGADKAHLPASSIASQAVLGAAFGLAVGPSIGMVGYMAGKEWGLAG
jgi:hypothetical protein